MKVLERSSTAIAGGMRNSMRKLSLIEMTPGRMPPITPRVKEPGLFDTSEVFR